MSTAMADLAGLSDLAFGDSGWGD